MISDHTTPTPTGGHAPPSPQGGSFLSRNPKLGLALKAVEVGGHMLYEKVKKPVARTIDDVPISGATVTTEWLTAVLCRNAPGAHVVSFSNPGGSSGSTERMALRVTYDEAGQRAGLPTELFTKSATAFSQRLLTGGSDVIHGEEHFFMGLRDKTTMEAPRGYWAKADDRSWRSIAIMEDIAATRGARFVGPTERLSREQMHDIVTTLACMHGQLWEDPAINVLHTLREYIQRTTAMVALRDRAEVGMERASTRSRLGCRAKPTGSTTRPSPRSASGPTRCRRRYCTAMRTSDRPTSPARGEWATPIGITACAAAGPTTSPTASTRPASPRTVASGSAG